MRKGIKTFFIVVVVLIAVLFGYNFVAGEQRDLFECGDNNELVVCPVGETPDAATHGDCRAVGDGKSTLDTGTCS